MQASFVDRSARGVSDHLPVVADIVVYAQPGTLPSGPPDDVSEAASVSDGLQPAHAACS
jgi:hypothetical protein